MATIKSLINRFTKIKSISLPNAMEASHQAILQFARKQFNTSGTYGGQPWSFYAGEPKYKAYKEALGASPMPLRWTGSLQRVFPALTNPYHPDHKWTNARGKVSLEISIPYLSRIETGGVNQFGETFPGRPIFPKKNGKFIKEVVDDIRVAYYRELAATGGQK